MTRSSRRGTAAAQLPLFVDLPAAARLRKRGVRTRYFFALWPDDPLRSQLQQASALIPPGAARVFRVAPARFHMTLAFLGALSTAQLEAAQKAGEAVQAAAFRMSIDTIGYFPNVRVAWLGPQMPPPALLRLKAELDRELLHLHLPVERAVFVPHLTCVRALDDAPDVTIAGIDWPVAAFALIRSRIKPGASAYQVLRRWRLTEPRPAAIE